MLRFALDVLMGLSCAGWVAAHPSAAHMIAAGEHAVGELLLRLTQQMAH